MTGYSTFAEGCGTVLGKIVVFIICCVVGGWGLMIGFGVVHHDIATPVPPLSYWVSVVLIWVGRCVYQGVTLTTMPTGGAS